jgi:replicative superfamily II helicase
MNAEISLGTVSNVREAVRWLTYTYFYIRLLRNPLMYGLKPDEVATYEQRNGVLDTIVRKAGKRLHSIKMIRYVESSSSFAITSLGRIASHYYIKSDSVEIYTKAIHDNMNDTEIFGMFGESKEFEQLKVRDEELNELMMLRESVND